MHGTMEAQRGAVAGAWSSFTPAHPLELVLGAAQHLERMILHSLLGAGAIVTLILVCGVALALTNAQWRAELCVDWRALYRAYRREKANARDAYEWKGRIYYLPPWEAEQRAPVLWGCGAAIAVIALFRGPEADLAMGFCALAMLAAWATPAWRAVTPPDYQKLVDAFIAYCVFAQIDPRLIPQKLWRGMALQAALAYRAAYVLADGDCRRRHIFAVRVMTAEVNKMSLALKTYMCDGIYLDDNAVHQALARYGVAPPYRPLVAA